MAKTATRKASDSFLGLEMEKFLPNKLLRDAIFFVVVIWGVAIILAALLFNVYLLTEGWAFLTPARLDSLIGFIEFSMQIASFAMSLVVGYLLGRSRRVWKKKIKSSKGSENFSL